MANSEFQKRGSAAKPAGFFSIFPLLAKLLWRYGKRLFSLDTIVALEKKQGGGSGERTVEEELLEQALLRNPHQYHVQPDAQHLADTLAESQSSLDKPVLIVRKGVGNEHRR
ncbi:hypothetical protein ACI77O_13320 [Pseudomonas tritici]|uniref:hypothetical protein n=1 Tax=Pseudomonas tritici TaxID=2745518 RepID=UPI00387B3C81